MKHPNIEPTDPRLTAYALGELDDATTRELAAAIDASPMLQAEVEDIRATAALLAETLREAPADALPAASRDEILRRAADTPAARSIETLHLLAAGLLLFTIGAFLAQRATLWVGSLLEEPTLRPPATAEPEVDPSVAAMQLALAAEDDLRLDLQARLEGLEAPSHFGFEQRLARWQEQLEQDTAGEPAPRNEVTEFLRAHIDSPLADIEVDIHGDGATYYADYPAPSPIWREILIPGILGKYQPIEDAELGEMTITYTLPEGPAFERAFADTRDIRGFDYRGLAPGERGTYGLHLGWQADSTFHGNVAVSAGNDFVNRVSAFDIFNGRDRISATFVDPPLSLSLGDDRLALQVQQGQQPASLAGDIRVGAVGNLRDQIAAVGSSPQEHFYRFAPDSTAEKPADAQGQPVALGAQLNKMGAASGLASAGFAYGIAGQQPVNLPAAISGEGYDPVTLNTYELVTESPLSTFSLDVDTASYSNVRRMLNQGVWPPPPVVRIEEMVNAFDYDYEAPGDEAEHPLAMHVETTTCPWTPAHRIVRIGVKAREIARDSRDPASLTFLIDKSGSMSPMNKLPLLKQAMKLLLGELLPTDHVGIVVFAGGAEQLLPPTPCSDKEKILQAIDSLHAGGSTNGASGIQLAYRQAEEAMKLPPFAGIDASTHRVILATDGDFNAGMTDRDDLVELIAKMADKGVFLSLFGFGTGNYKDGTLEALSNRGNGNYGYIDTLEEAERALVYELEGTLFTVAKDVKVQVEFNPAQVERYRLIGYENRALAARDFTDDKKDAGDVGAGHTVTALYEVVPTGLATTSGTPELRYQNPKTQPEASEAPHADELLTVKLRYKLPEADESTEMKVHVTDDGKGYADASCETRFALAVATFARVLAEPGQVNTTFDAILELAGECKGADELGNRAGFLELVKKAKALSGR